MTLGDLPLQKLLALAAYETDGDKLRELVQEINQRYQGQDSNITFDIFEGILDRNAQWVEAVVGLGAANERMQEIATRSRGAYFVFHAASRRVLARIDSGPIKASQEEDPPKTGTG